MLALRLSGSYVDYRAERSQLCLLHDHRRPTCLVTLALRENRLEESHECRVRRATRHVHHHRPTNNGADTEVTTCLSLSTSICAKYVPKDLACASLTTTCKTILAIGKMSFITIQSLHLFFSSRIGGQVIKNIPNRQEGTRKKKARFHAERYVPSFGANIKPINRRLTIK